MGDDWFDEVLDEAVKEGRKRLAKRGGSYTGGRILPAVIPVSNPAAAREAAARFKDVASGRAPSLGTGISVGGTLAPTPEQGLEAILRAARADPASAGAWITRVTNGIIEITREEENDD